MKAKDAQGTPTQSHISPSILACEYNRLRMVLDIECRSSWCNVQTLAAAVRGGKNLREGNNLRGGNKRRSIKAAASGPDAGSSAASSSRVHSIERGENDLRGGNKSRRRKIFNEAKTFTRTPGQESGCDRLTSAEFARQRTRLDLMQ